ncbi:hypothetical protein [Novosphingobium sp.]|uniref:hypothetical protein n=1 Tax=Novosphingobium sp. TaxID=1874826 RepID=UPI0038B9C618
MSSTTLDYRAIIARAQTGYQAEENAIQPLSFAYFKALVSASGMAIACASEAFAITISLHAQYPALSSGVDLGSDMLSMRWSIVAGLLLGHAVLHDSAEPSGQPARWLIRKLRVVPILAVMGGIAVFQFSTAQTTGDDGQGGLGASALGLAMAGLFGCAFLASNRLAGILLPAIRTILSGRAQRGKLAQIARELDAASACNARIKALQGDIAHREAPNALRRKAAEEAAMVVGRVAAEAHDHHASREALGDSIRPEDVVDLPDTPLPALDKRQAYLKSLNVSHFLNLLTPKEA